MDLSLGLAQPIWQPFAAYRAIISTANGNMVIKSVFSLLLLLLSQIYLRAQPHFQSMDSHIQSSRDFYKLASMVGCQMLTL